MSKEQEIEQAWAQQAKEKQAEKNEAWEKLEAERDKGK